MTEHKIEYWKGYAENAQALCREQADEIERLRVALDRLSRLGNEPMHGNSDGNLIAYRALVHTSDNGDGND